MKYFKPEVGQKVICISRANCNSTASRYIEEGGNPTDKRSRTGGGLDRPERLPNIVNNTYEIF